MGASGPAAASDPLAKAIELLAEGAWQPAHDLVQREKSPLAAWLHGIAHTVEGDLENARYWYRRADRAFPGRDALEREIAAARDALRDRSHPERCEGFPGPDARRP